MSHASASGARMLLMPMKIATSAFTAMKLTAHHVLATASSMISMRWKVYSLGETSNI
jgi:hypothetical protein